MPTVRFQFDNNRDVIVPDGWYSNDYQTRATKEPYFREIITQFIRSGFLNGNIIDGGAFIGDNAVPWALNTSNMVYAIDPSSGNCKYIKELMKLNDISNLKVLEYALSDKEGTLSTPHDLYHCSFFENTGSTTVDSTSIDSLFLQNEIDNIGFIHLDIEGLEYKTLRGAKTVIETFKPLIAFEQHLDRDDYIVVAKYLQSFGYKVYMIHEELEMCRADCRNFLASCQPLPTDLKLIEVLPSNHEYIDHVESALRTADKYYSKCTGDILRMEGMSGKKTRHFYNNVCSLDDCRYMEIGTWRGSTLCSALYGNTMKSVAIDNWSYDPNDRTIFLKNLSKYSCGNQVKVIEKDSWNVTESDIDDKFNIYLYDGDHQRSSQCKALTHYITHMDDVFIYIVDDWNDLRVRQGTYDGIQQTNSAILYQRAIFTTNDNSHPKIHGENSDWHNGISIFVLQKNHL